MGLLSDKSCCPQFKAVRDESVLLFATIQNADLSSNYAKALRLSTKDP